tara:strand:+ start:13509 stop:13685 length:177 start_codon:yes stop_codon:yes gene_type:complete
MTAAEEAKASGFKSLAQVAELFSTTTQCLRNWHKYNRVKFEIVLLGCKEYLKEKDGDT